MSPDARNLSPHSIQRYPDPDIEDRELVGRLRAGDQAAFRTMFATYYQPLCDFVGAYVRAPDAAEELVQNVFLNIWEQRAEWKPEGVRAYLYGACRNRALSYHRHERTVVRGVTW